MKAKAVITTFTLAGALLAGPCAAGAQESGPAPAAAPLDYASSDLWLCRPGRADACSRADENATIIRADGTRVLDRFAPAADPPIDCFYVYPTVSRDPAPNANAAVEPEEALVVQQQFARFASRCRTYAPVYRQITLAALRATMGGVPTGDRALAYGDVVAAWRYYLQHDNQGRGVVLIGHSQGSGMLIRLVQREIDGRPVQKRIVSIILGGARLQVPKGSDVGGDFKSIPLCRSPGQTGCAINFASFRSDSPPPDNSRFGGSDAPGLEAACSNPAALAGGSGPLEAYLTSGGEAIGAGAAPVWTRPPVPVATPFVEAPGLLSAECASDGRHTWLAITVHRNPGGARTDEIAGDVRVGGAVLKDWGLHLIDMNLVMGNLIDDVAAETRSYQARGG